MWLSEGARILWFYTYRINCAPWGLHFEGEDLMSPVQGMITAQQQRHCIAMEVTARYAGTPL